MLAPESSSTSKSNRSSKTKTTRNDRKQHKTTLKFENVQDKLQAMLDNDELLLPQVLDDAMIQTKLAEFTDGMADSRDRIYTPQVTLSLFVQQVLTKDKGCQEMVTLLNKQRKARQIPPVSTNTTSYCRARARLPLKLIEALAQETSNLAKRLLPQDWLWKGHRTLLVDGFVVNAPDTPENQEKYPQPTSQKPGLGLSLIHI